jgi:hypothetical protein
VSECVQRESEARRGRKREARRGKKEEEEEEEQKLQSLALGTHLAAALLVTISCLC